MKPNNLYTIPKWGKNDENQVLIQQSLRTQPMLSFSKERQK